MAVVNPNASKDMIGTTVHEDANIIELLVRIWVASQRTRYLLAATETRTRYYKTIANYIFKGRMLTKSQHRWLADVGANELQCSLADLRFVKLDECSDDQRREVKTFGERKVAGRIAALRTACDAVDVEFDEIANHPGIGEYMNGDSGGSSPPPGGGSTPPPQAAPAAASELAELRALVAGLAVTVKALAEAQTGKPVTANGHGESVDLAARIRASLGAKSASH